MEGIYSFSYQDSEEGEILATHVHKTPDIMKVICASVNYEDLYVNYWLSGVWKRWDLVHIGSLGPRVLRVSVARKVSRVQSFCTGGLRFPCPREMNIGPASCMTGVCMSRDDKAHADYSEVS
jgi:hypothetical protein